MNAPVERLEAASCDFDRRVYGILGLPFDKVTLQEAVARGRAAIERRQSFFVATPNANNIVECLQDADFRQTVLSSNLSIPDGISVILFARLYGVPFRQRASGACFFDELVNLSNPRTKPVTVFFFGGKPGIAELASDKLNTGAHDTICRGTIYPGFDSVAAMSQEAYLQTINQSQADFLVLALSSKKGYAWIQHNRPRLQTPLLAQLGAVINFVAGNVRRAPATLQDMGLEWLWRIYQEPYLWKRYARDGLALLRLLLCNGLPYWIWRNTRAYRLRESKPLRVLLEANNAETKLMLAGSATGENLDPLRLALKQLQWQDGITLILDIGGIDAADSAFIGLCMLAHGEAVKFGGRLRLLHPTPRVRNILRWHCANFLTET